MERIGFIGLGIMGKPMARNLLRVGHELTFYARRPEVIEEMKQAGAHFAESPKEVAQQADIIITIVTADAQVKEVILGSGGVLDGVSTGDLIVDMSTISPLTVREIGTEAEKKGAWVMDAPVSGGETGAQNGTLTIIAGGYRKDMERCRPIFEVLGDPDHIFHVGALGLGQTVKLMNQLIGSVTMAAIGEALCLGAVAGADPEIMRQVISVSSGNSTLFEARVEKFILADQFEPGFMLDLMKKDLRLAVELGRNLNVQMPVGSAAFQMYSLASRLGHGSEDFAAVCRSVESMSGSRIADALSRPDVTASQRDS